MKPFLDRRDGRRPFRISARMWALLPVQKDLGIFYAVSHQNVLNAPFTPATALCQRSSSSKNVRQFLLILPPTFVKELLITRAVRHTSTYAAKMQQRQPLLSPVAQIHLLEGFVRTEPQENRHHPRVTTDTQTCERSGGVGKSPESKSEIHKLAVFELEVIVQLLNDHSIRLSHLLLPLIFTAK